MDNKLPIRGNNRYRHSFGLVIRLCLSLGIQPLFIPLAKPWRNGIIEHFQNVFGKMFFRTQYFKDFDHLYKQAKEFELFHNQNHRYSTLEGMTPNQKRSGNIKLLPASFRLPNKLTTCSDYAHWKKYVIPADVDYEYIWVTIDTIKQKLFMYYNLN